jgi:hypothetical protein
MWDALSDERTGLSFARVTVSSNKSVASMYNLHVHTETQTDFHMLQHGSRREMRSGFFLRVHSLPLERVYRTVA